MLYLGYLFVLFIFKILKYTEIWLQIGKRGKILQKKLKYVQKMGVNCEVTNKIHCSREKKSDLLFNYKSSTYVQKAN